MAKYDPLRDYLLRQRATELDLSFREIERKLGYMLPNMAARSEWWASAGDPGGGRSRSMPGAPQVTMRRWSAKSAYSSADDQ